jgi:D-alanine-D-alanine ligase
MHIFRTFPLPVVVKPAASGSSVGVSIVKKFQDIEAAVKLAFKSGDTVIVEEFVPGIEATCGVVDGLRGVEIYALPPVEIRPTHGGFFDYAAKYEGKSNEIVPGNFSPADKAELARLSEIVHRTLGLRHYSRSDFIISPKRGICFLEVNTLPGMTDASLLPKSLAAVGVKLSDFFDHLIGLAINGK